MEFPNSQIITEDFSSLTGSNLILAFSDSQGLRLQPQQLGFTAAQDGTQLNGDFPFLTATATANIDDGFMRT